jgi:branched-chain amino acid transport system ATP-binding protein
LGRALISSPQLLILDEPAAGMNSTETEALSALIRRIRDELGVTILLVEHDMNLVMGICERICVINFGKKIAEGAPEEIRNNPVVQEAYLGKEEVQSA